MSSSLLTGFERKSSAPASMPRMRLGASSRAVTSTMGMSAVASSALRRSQISNPLLPGSMTSRRMRSGVEDMACTSALSPSCTVSTAMPSLRRRRARSAAMSGSSSTTSTRKPAWAGACSAASAAGSSSLIGDLDLREIGGVGGDAFVEARAIAAARAVLDLAAERRDLLEAVGVAHALHAVAELAQALEVGRRHGGLQRLELLVPVVHEHGNEVFQVLVDHNLDLIVHVWIIGSA